MITYTVISKDGNLLIHIPRHVQKFVSDRVKKYHTFSVFKLEREINKQLDQLYSKYSAKIVIFE